MEAINIPKAKNPESNWMALDDNYNLISEGITPYEAIRLAKEKTDNFIILFIFKEGETYIF
jgi:hypothetical protein